jgi:hypothetical protein
MLYIYKMVSTYHKIINKYITNNAKCHKLLSSDGITSRNLVIEKVTGILDGIILNTRSEVSVLPNITKAAGIAKNLDEYQYIVCSEVGDIPDANSYKRDLQKYRIAIIAAFSKLVSVLLLRSDKELQKWNHFAQILLTEVSETHVKIRLQDKDHNINNDLLKSTFDYFDISVSDLDRLLESIYRQ